MLALHSIPRQRLLAFYFTNSTARRHLRDLGSSLAVDPSNLSRELRRLEREGLFRSEVSAAKSISNSIENIRCSKEVRSIVNKTIGAKFQIAAVLKIKGIEEAYLYGSFARNQQDAASDIDVLIIGNPGAEILAVAIRNSNANSAAK